jgi:hypothetical protein
MPELLDPFFCAWRSRVPLVLYLMRMYVPTEVEEVISGLGCGKSLSGRIEPIEPD